MGLAHDAYVGVKQQLDFVLLRPLPDARPLVVIEVVEDDVDRLAVGKARSDRRHDAALDEIVAQLDEAPGREREPERGRRARAMRQMRALTLGVKVAGRLHSTSGTVNPSRPR